VNTPLWIERESPVTSRYVLVVCLGVLVATLLIRPSQSQNFLWANKGAQPMPIPAFVYPLSDGLDIQFDRYHSCNLGHKTSTVQLNHASAKCSVRRCAR
jgi:hypothetical protein